MTMEFPMEKKTKNLQVLELPAIKEASRETIFNPVNFIKIFNRTVNIKSDAQRQWGIMNIVQMLNHLKVATASGINIYKLKDESTFWWRVVLKFIALRILKRFPRNVRAAE